MSKFGIASDGNGGYNISKGLTHTVLGVLLTGFVASIMATLAWRERLIEFEVSTNLRLGEIEKDTDRLSKLNAYFIEEHLTLHTRLGIVCDVPSKYGVEETNQFRREIGRYQQRGVVP